MGTIANETRGNRVRRKILGYLEQHPEGATIEELKVPCGLSSKASIHHHVMKLANVGLIIHRRHKSRVFLGKAPASVTQALRLVESCIGVFDGATRWADAYAGVDRLREAAEILKMIKGQDTDERDTS